MGSLGSRLQSSTRGLEEAEEGTSTSRRHACECRKRKRNAQCDCESEQEEDDAILDTPRRKKLKSTSKYIYQTLFLNGENSDIRICALGQEWNLHKVYLCQSGYFSSMFSGSWKESNMMEINLEIPDQNIDTEALQVVFGSLYRDDVLIKPSRVVSILAAACMLQLDGLIQQCGETMKENIGVKTVCGYYACAYMYGLDSVLKKCLEWLLNNLMTHQNIDLMKELGPELMEQLIHSSDLFVMQVEMDVYTALKKWMFLQLNPTWDGPIKQLLVDADAWFCKRRSDQCEKEPFLNTEEGAAFCSVFKHVRLQYIINDLASARILERDNILPPDWLTVVYKSQWFAMLRTEFDNDNGPQEANKDEFELNSMRCGRKLTKDGDVASGLIRQSRETSLQSLHWLPAPHLGKRPGIRGDEPGQPFVVIPAVRVLQLPVHVPSFGPKIGLSRREQLSHRVVMGTAASVDGRQRRLVSTLTSHH
ncbi:germ cell-less protein-like 1 isoform X2 [Synchiropus splendidus]|uniref:germ cell-less protein-like 1 isoform X2 n=1 Tax=Synchiropus splendidus TaxID=270530 RepID=UPI00237EC91B|nr:germ cell-less protein-like 1 isoform X2 [Synchiropus splendidus]